MCSKIARSLPQGPARDVSVHKPKLSQLGFTEEQAAHTLAYSVRRKRSFPIDNVQPWLHLLHKLNVEHPVQVLSKRPVLLASRASTAEANMEGLVELLGGLGATQKQLAALLYKHPMLFNIPPTTPSAAAAWLRSKLHLSSSVIADLFTKYSELFYMSCEDLDVTLAWFLSMGYSIETVRQKPQLLRSKLSTTVNKAKVRFLTQVMQKDVEELQTCTQFLRYSLFQNIGPRWAFHSLYCKGQPFVLSTRLNVNDAGLVQKLDSSSLDEECKVCSLTRLEVYEKFKIKWQEGEGKIWDVRGAKNDSG